MPDAELARRPPTYVTFAVRPGAVNCSHRKSGRPRWCRACQCFLPESLSAVLPWLVSLERRGLKSVRSNGLRDTRVGLVDRESVSADNSDLSDWPRECEPSE